MVKGLAKMRRVDIEGVADPISVDTNNRLLDALALSGTGLLTACGGKGLCATCHVYVKSGADRLSPITPREQASLRMLNERRADSRLACQAKVRGDGVTVALPRGRYLTATRDLEGLVGRRADVRILHPIDGRILIEAGKIITRSGIQALAAVDVDVAEVASHSLSLR
jgi:ferredoxin